MRTLLALLGLTGLLLSACGLGGTEFVATGAGTAQFTHPGQAAQQCPAIQAVFEWHQRISNENVLNARFAAGQGSPVTLCAPGWGFSFLPDEVRGTPDTGITAYRTSPDATIWLTLTAPHAGLHHLHVHQVTSLSDIMDFDGDVSRLA
ncbi:MAG: hypothetical protein LC624_10535 [Halobacteriales archaeon]|nr:hypothetical protein [Halobacteriales archaeon]